MPLESALPWCPCPASLPKPCRQPLARPNPPRKHWRCTPCPKQRPRPALGHPTQTPEEGRGSARAGPRPGQGAAPPCPQPWQPQPAQLGRCKELQTFLQRQLRPCSPAEASDVSLPCSPLDNFFPDTATTKSFSSLVFSSASGAEKSYLSLAGNNLKHYKHISLCIPSRN